VPISRRDFLGASAFLGGAVAAAPDPARPAVAALPSFVRFGRTELAVIRDADAVVAGGSLSGVAAALRFAQSGRRVVFVERRSIASAVRQTRPAGGARSAT
jgi:heterodisulfide reductase subunit A-like polyferredoxin